MSLILSKNETTSMRGVAIVFIMLHNLLHWVTSTTENEFTFSLDKAHYFVEEVMNYGCDIYQDIFSFLGWYGVAIFLFLSGYGLTMKYDHPNSPPLAVKWFVWKHFKSVFLLMILPYIPFAMMQIFYSSEYAQVLLQTTLLSNIIRPNKIEPGVFWFFGLIFQFYALYAILKSRKLENKFNKILIGLNVASLIWLSTLEHNQNLLNWARHNFVGWLLPFSLGIWFAKYRGFEKLFSTMWKNFLWLIICGSLLVLSNFNYYAWIFSTAFAVFAAIGLTKLVSLINNLNEFCIWIGTLSAFIFAIHPAIRFLCVKICWDKMDSFIYIFMYFIVTVVVAIIYKEIHKKFFTRYLI